MKKLYSTTMTNTGGRSGNVSAPDNSLSLKMAPPGGNDKSATNPEQLFAAGYSSCFNSALEMILMHQKIKTQSSVTAIVSLYEKEPFDYGIGVEIEGHIDGLSKEKTQEMLLAAHAVCPYSKAIKGNIEVTIKAV